MIILLAMSLHTQEVKQIHLQKYWWCVYEAFLISVTVSVLNISVVWFVFASKTNCAYVQLDLNSVKACVHVNEYGYNPNKNYRIHGWFLFCWGYDPQLENMIQKKI